SAYSYATRHIVLHLYLFCFLIRRPPSPPLFPYTTLFRSQPGPLKRLHQELLLGGRIIGHLRSGRTLPGDDHPVGELGIVVHKLEDRKSTRLNSSHVKISYAVFCLKKKITSMMV